MTAQPTDGPAATDIDRLNLEQVLLDFDIANARVMDLTQRLTTLSEQLIAARTEVERTAQRASLAEDEAVRLRSELALVQTSLAYRGFRVLGDSRARLRRR